MADDTNTAERAGAYDMIDRFLRNNLSSDEDYAEYSKALDLVLGASLAASAGSEPVAWRDPSNMCDDQSFTLSRERAKKWPHIYKQPLYTHPSPPEGAGQALRKVLSVVQRYLPPDGPSAHDAMSEITGIVDPWPLGPLEKP